jgi:hypothetical protein
MGLGGASALVTTWTLVWLRRRAYTAGEFKRLAAASAFRAGRIDDDGVGVAVRLTKP